MGATSKGRASLGRSKIIPGPPISCYCRGLMGSLQHSPRPPCIGGHGTLP